MPPAYLKAVTIEPPPTGCHAIERAWQRYGTRLGWADLGNIVHMIQENQGKLVSHSPGETSEWLLTYRDVEYRVVIDPSFWHVVTFLPPHVKKPSRRRQMFYKNGVKKWENA